jgi:branched-chain amino acid transport system substrate-binding protein
LERYKSMKELIAALERPPRLRVWSAAAAGGVVACLAVGVALGAGRSGHAGASGALATKASVVATARECTTNRACVERHGGEPWACRPTDGACVPIATDDCTPMFEPGDLTADDTVWLGAMFPVKGPSYGKMNMDGADMARREFAAATSSLSLPTASLHVKRIALVGCDDRADASRAAHHLVDDVGVPAILGFGSGKMLTELEGSLLVPRRVMSVATLTSSPLITRVPQPTDLPRLIWRTSYSIEATADATAAFVTALEARRGLARTHLTLVREDSQPVLPFAQRLFRKLVFNGKPAADNGSDYREVVFTGDAADDARRIVQGRPTLVVLMGSGDATGSRAQAVEAIWPPSMPRPYYVIAEDTTATLAAIMEKSPEARHRVFAVSAASIPATTAHFVLRFNLAHAGEATETVNPGTTYDAFYMLAYAVFATGDQPVTGPAIAGAMRRLLPPGAPIETGSTDVFTALSALSRGESIDLSGPSGSLDFDPQSGEWSPDFTLLCAALDKSGHVTDAESGLVQRGKSHALEGTIRCRD